MVQVEVRRCKCREEIGAQGRRREKADWVKEDAQLWYGLDKVGANLSLETNVAVSHAELT